MPDHGGNRTYDLWNASPVLYQLSYAVRSVRVYDVFDINLILRVIMIICILLLCA